MPSKLISPLEALERRNRDQPAQIAYLFEDREHTYGELWGEIERFARGLVGRGSPASETGEELPLQGDRVVLVLPNGPEMFAAFYGCQRAGAVPVPLYPESGADRVLDLATACGATRVVWGSDVSEATLATTLLQAGENLHVVTCGEILAAAPEDGALPAFQPPDPEATALLQYTSGSTGDPKGVIVSHANLATNVGQMIDGMEITAEDVFVSWLPVHHDMGLVLMTMVPFTIGARLVLLPSSLTDIRRWLQAIATHKGTFTAAPDFAYRLCLAAVRDPTHFDLSSLRVALNAAEPVRATTIRRFEEMFDLDRVMVAGYGLAEATVGVSMQPSGTAPVISPRGLVAIGEPFPDVRIHIRADTRSPVEGRPARVGEIGELWVESPANTSGYYSAPEATARLLDGSGCIRTGDLGYRDEDGHVFLVGRSKNIILQAGHNLAPQELEEAVDALPFVRRSAAVGIDRGRVEGEQAYIFAELRRALPPPANRLQEMATEVVARIHRRLGLRPGRVCLLPPRTIPLTSNGKIRHAALRAAYLDGTLQDQGRILYPID